MCLFDAVFFVRFLSFCLLSFVFGSICFFFFLKRLVIMGTGIKRRPHENGTPPSFDTGFNSYDADFPYLLNFFSDSDDFYIKLLKTILKDLDKIEEDLRPICSADKVECSAYKEMGGYSGTESTRPLINSTHVNVDNLGEGDFKHLWFQCDYCYGINYKKFFYELRLNICEYCDRHLRLCSPKRIELLIDSGTWYPMFENLFSIDAIGWDHPEEKYYLSRLISSQKKTGLTEAVQTGTGLLNGIPIALGVMEFEFIGGSMGSVVGERITRLIEYATNESLPLLIVCASGGARMQEGSLSLMQMAKIASALHNYQSNKKLFYVSLLTSPTTGGVTASFGMSGDIIIAEPNAYIAFAGKRVIEQTLNKEVPEGLQEAENLFEKGLLDPIVPRHLLKGVLAELFEFLGFLPSLDFKKSTAVDSVICSKQ
uniref:Acetyl-coenzyme A carboxylase carboxyl transferase subunit beta, chloroplastic n=1 Tax=Epipremnum aureum TaxID=78380 RepID=A0A0M4B472_9ARAE|nr:acetyl-CoA carboxylase beta subunit [Epipremnum aureum]ALB38592.1 acetyl-CoA carboxylase beta subunit [Epipremnum aureum]